MKKFYTVLSVALLMSSVAFAQTAPVKNVPNRPSKEAIMEKRKAAMTEQLAKMPKEQLEKQKASIEKRLAAEKDEKKAEFMKVRLDAINSLLK